MSRGFVTWAPYKTDYKTYCTTKRESMADPPVVNSPSKERAEYSELLLKMLTALFYGISSFMIMVVNKRVLTVYSFPSFQGSRLSNTDQVYWPSHIFKFLELVRCLLLSSSWQLVNPWKSSHSLTCQLRHFARSGPCPWCTLETWCLGLEVLRTSVCPWWQFSEGFPFWWRW